jgi:hypothetical protein
MCEEEWGKDPYWYNECTKEDSRWSITVDEYKVDIWDFKNDENRRFARSKLNDLAFSIAKIFVKPQMNRTPMSVWEGGYPDLDDYNRYEWPAINWMTL